MADDSGDGLIGLLIALAVVGGIIYGLVLFVKYFWPYILSAIGSGGSGYLLYRVLSTKYRLTRRGARVVFVAAGAAAWLLTICIVSGTHSAPPLALFVAPCLFCLSSLAIVTTWGALLKNSAREGIRQLGSQADREHVREAGLEAQIRELEGAIAEIHAAHGGNLLCAEELRARAGALVAQEPRGLGLVAGEFAAQLAGMSDQEVEDYSGAAPTAMAADQLRSVLAQIEGITRTSGPAGAKETAISEELAQLNARLEEARQGLAALEAARLRHETSFQAFARQRMEL